MIVNGWTLLAHACFLDQIERLAAAVQTARARDPDGYRHNANTRLLAAIVKLATVDIPTDPAAARWRQGGTLGPDRRHWFRAKFAQGRFRLFFRFHSTERIIVHAWVNDTRTLRKRGARTDPYAVFATMLAAGHPPDDWTALKQAATAEAGRWERVVRE